MKELRRKVLLPVFQLSQVTSERDPRALKRTIKQGKGHVGLTYYYRFVVDDETQLGFNYNLLPVVLDRKSAPWPPACNYMLSQLEGDTNPSMATYQARAEDIGAFKEWLDSQNNPDELLFYFPKIKLRRATYRYRGWLQQQIQAREIAPATARRRMGAVVSFYRWMIAHHYFEPEYAPWEEREYQLGFKSQEGRLLLKKVLSTDVAIMAPKAHDPLAGTIQDGGKLRPLTSQEQVWLMDATSAMGNTECYLIQLFMLATGARIQTAGTLRLCHFHKPNPGFSKALFGGGEVYRVKAGPGTGIDTKNDKNGTLQVPRPLYELLHTYALSDRAKLRRNRFLAKHEGHPDPYLFITRQGSPYFAAKADVRRFDPDLKRRHEKTGQPIREFITTHVIPHVQQHHAKQFHYRIHDLRASFGMNITEELMAEVEKKTITLSKARMIVKDLLWHESFATTDLYLDFKSQMAAMEAAINGYGEQLARWIGQARAGLAIDE